jgi:hypothetical protein
MLFLTLRRLEVSLQDSVKRKMVLARAAIPTYNVTQNLGAILLFYLKHQSLQIRGPIACGGVIIVLANALRLDIGNLSDVLFFLLLMLVAWSRNVIVDIIFKFLELGVYTPLICLTIYSISRMDSCIMMCK